MKKRYLAAGALALTCASCLALTGCDLFGSNSGNGGNGGGDLSGITGPTVTQSQWQNVFGNEKYNKNFTTDISATVTVQAVSGAEKNTSKVKGLFCADGGKNYSSIYGDGYKIEMYELHNASDDYFWVRYDDGAEWEREKVNGLPLSAVVLADYAECYNCFEYDSKTKSYEATEKGLGQITDIYVSSLMGGSSAIAGMTLELTEASFTLENGLPVGAHMRLLMQDDMGLFVDQDLDYTFFDFGTTTVSFPKQIQEWLDQNGVDTEEPPQGEIVVPTPSGAISEREWREIFENENNCVNLTSKLYAEAYATVKSPSGQSETEVTNAYLSLSREGNKFHAYLNDMENEPEDSFAYLHGDEFYYWRYNEKGELESDVSNASDVNQFSLLTFSNYADCYGYFAYNEKTDRYEVTKSGLKEMLAVIKNDSANNEMIFQQCDTLAECYFVIQDGKVVEAKILGTVNQTELGMTLTGEVEMRYEFTDYGTTEVVYPNEIQKQIDLLGEPNQPAPTPSGKISEKEWRNIFQANAENFTADFSGTVVSKHNGESQNITLEGKFFNNGVKSRTVSKVYIPGYGGATTEMYTYSANGEKRCWVEIAGGGFSEQESPEFSTDNISLYDYVDLYAGFTYNVNTGRYEANASGLNMLTQRLMESLGSVPDMYDEVEITECAFVLGSNVPFELTMTVIMTQSAYGMKVESVETITYEFSDFGTTRVRFPAEIQEQIDGNEDNFPDEHKHVGDGKYVEIGEEHYQSCRDCGAPMYDKHVYVGGVCICGAKQNTTQPDPAPEKPSVTEGTYGLEYSLTADGKGYAVEGIGTAKDSAIVIPAEYKGLPVKEIRNSAFAYDESITSVVISESVSVIGSSAFRGCNALEYIVIAQSVESIGSSAFRDCTSLVAVYYAGAASDWEYVNVGSSNNPLIKAEMYFYSASKPVTAGNYWYLSSDGVTPVQW